MCQFPCIYCVCGMFTILHFFSLQQLPALAKVPQRLLFFHFCPWLQSIRISIFICPSISAHYTIKYAQVFLRPCNILQYQAVANIRNSINTHKYFYLYLCYIALSVAWAVLAPLVYLAAVLLVGHCCWFRFLYQIPQRPTPIISVCYIRVRAFCMF